MRTFFLFAVVAFLVLACGNSSSSDTSTAAARVGSQQPDGAKIFKQYCVTCHGLYGDMGASGAANLKSSALSLDERVKVITNGRNTMASFKSLLNEEKIKAVAEYTMTLTEKRDSTEIKE